MFQTLHVQATRGEEEGKEVEFYRTPDRNSPHVLCFIYPHGNSATVFRGEVTGTWAGQGGGVGGAARSAPPGLSPLCEGNAVRAGTACPVTAGQPQQEVSCAVTPAAPAQALPWGCGRPEGKEQLQCNKSLRHLRAQAGWGRQVTGCGPRPHRAANQSAGRE